MSSSMYGAGGYGSGAKTPSGYSSGRVQNFTPQQMQLFEQMLSGIGGGIGGGLDHLSKIASGDQSYFDQLEAPALRQFGAVQGNLASRFSGMGTGSRRSSGFGNAMSSASQELSESLQSQRMGLQQNAIKELLGLSQSLLSQRPYEQTLTPKKKPFWQELLASLGQAGGQALMGGF